MVRTTIIVLIMMVERPIVRMARGRASIFTRGLMIELMREKIRPATAKSTQVYLYMDELSASIVPSQVIQKYIPMLDASQRKMKAKSCRLIILYIIA